MDKLILYNGPNSPFGRKTKITAIVQDIKIEEKIVKVEQAEFLDNFNSKIILTVISICLG